MRVLSTILAAAQAVPEFAMLERDENYPRKHPINKLATSNKLANRLAVFSKGGNADNVDEVTSGDYDKVMNHNNKYFTKLRDQLMEDKDGDGEPDCGLMEKVKKQKNTDRRRRSTGYGSLALTQDDYENLCDDLEGEDEDLQCVKNENGSIQKMDAEDSDASTLGRSRKSFDLDPAKFLKNARKVHTSVKRFTTTFLWQCENNEGTRNDKRLKRNLLSLSRRVRDGIRSGYTTVEEAEKIKWKRLFPNTPKGGPNGEGWQTFFMNKATPKVRGPKDE